MINKLKGTRRYPGFVVGQLFESRTDKRNSSAICPGPSANERHVDQQLKAGTFSASLRCYPCEPCYQDSIHRVRVRLWRLHSTYSTG